MNLLDAVAIVLAYQAFPRLNGAQRRLLMTAQKTIWDHAEMIKNRAEDRG